jgi:hypothetical protein
LEQQMAHLVGHRQAETKSRVDFPLGGGLAGCISEDDRRKPNASEVMGVPCTVELSQILSSRWAADASSTHATWIPTFPNILVTSALA